MNEQNHTSRRVRFFGFVRFWAMPRNPGESTRQRFFSIYADLSRAIEQQSLSANMSGVNPNWKLVRISGPGRWFLGFVRR